MLCVLDAWQVYRRCPLTFAVWKFQNLQSNYQKVLCPAFCTYTGKGREEVELSQVWVSELWQWLTDILTLKSYFYFMGWLPDIRQVSFVWYGLHMEILHYSGRASLHDLEVFSLNISVCCKQYRWKCQQYITLWSSIV